MPDKEFKIEQSVKLEKMQQVEQEVLIITL